MRYAPTLTDEGAGTRPASLPRQGPSADARPYTGYVHSGSFGYPAKFAGPRRGPPKHLNGAQPQQLNTYLTTTFSVRCPTLMM